MITSDKFPNAMYSLQALLLHMRYISNDIAKKEELYSLLDYAELLPFLIASKQDETERYKNVLIEVAQRFSCEWVLQRFNEPPPSNWCG